MVNYIDADYYKTTTNHMKEDFNVSGLILRHVFFNISGNGLIKDETQ